MDGRFGRDDFHYDEEADSDRCPAGQTLVHGGGIEHAKGKRYLVYRSRSEVCGACPLKEQCVSPSKTYRLDFRYFSISQK